jgi:hypothetical protein
VTPQFHLPEFKRLLAELKALDELAAPINLSSNSDAEKSVHRFED